MADMTTRFAGSGFRQTKDYDSNFKIISNGDTDAYGCFIFFLIKLHEFNKSKKRQIYSYCECNFKDQKNFFY